MEILKQYKSAILKGNSKQILKLLKEKKSPITCDDYSVIEMAIQRENGCIKRLIGDCMKYHCDTATKEWFCFQLFQCALQHGRTDIVVMLLQFVPENSTLKKDYIIYSLQSTAEFNLCTEKFKFATEERLDLFHFLMSFGYIEQGRVFALNTKRSSEAHVKHSKKCCML